MAGFYRFAQVRKVGKAFRRRPVEQFLVVDQRYGFHAYRETPDLVVVPHGFPTFGKVFCPKLIRQIERGDKPGVSPFSYLVMSPYDNVRALATLRSCRKAVCDIFRRFDLHVNAKLILEFQRNGFKRSSAFGIHPDEQVSARPGVSGSSERPEKKRQQISLHSKKPFQKTKRYLLLWANISA